MELKINTSKTPTEDYMHHAMTLMMFKHKQVIIQTSCNTLVSGAGCLFTRGNRIQEFQIEFLNLQLTCT